MMPSTMTVVSAFIACALLGAHPAYASDTSDAVGFDVSPAAVEHEAKPGERLRIPLSLAATGDASVPVHLSLRAIHQELDGAYTDQDMPSALAHAVSLSATSTIARRGEPGEVAVNLTAPTKPGVLVFGVTATPAERRSVTTQNEHGVAAKLAFEFRYLVVFVIRVLPATMPPPRLDVQQLELTPDGAAIHVRAVSRDPYDRDAKAEALLIDKSTLTVLARLRLAPARHADAAGRFRLLPGGELSLEGLLTSPPRAGHLLLKVQMQSSGRRIDRRMELDFTPPARGDVAAVGSNIAPGDVAAVGSSLVLATSEIECPTAAGATRLRTIEIANTGSRPLDYVLSVVQPDAGPGSSARSWVELTPDHGTLAPGAKRKIAALVRVPEIASTGRYEATIEVEPLNAPLGSAQKIPVVVTVGK